MKVYSEISLKNFEPWGGSESVFYRLSLEEIEILEEIIEDCYPDGIDEITLNDVFWHDKEWVFETIGIFTDDDETWEDKQKKKDEFFERPRIR